MKRARLSIFLALPLLLGGCLKPATTSTAPAALAPGAVNSFDQNSYTTLLTAQDTYNSLLASYKANPTVLAMLKAPLDDAATTINLAEVAWQAYHAAALAGTSTPAQQTAVTTSLTAAQTALAKVKP